MRTSAYGFLQVCYVSWETAANVQDCAGSQATLWGNSEQSAMKTSNNVIFQRKAGLTQADPDRTRYEIASNMKLYDIFATVWILSGSQPSKDKDSG